MNTPTSEQIETYAKFLNMSRGNHSIDDMNEQLELVINERVEERVNKLAQLLADQQANNGWLFDIENAPRSDQEIDLLVEDAKGKVHHLENMWFLDTHAGPAWRSSSGDGTILEKHHKFIAYRLIELPEGGE